MRLANITEAPASEPLPADGRAIPEPASESRRLGKYAPRHLRAHGSGLRPSHRRLRRRGRSRALHAPGLAVGLERARASSTPAVARAATPPCCGWPAPKSSASIWPEPCCMRPGGSMTARTSVRATCGAYPSPRPRSTPSGASPLWATCRPPLSTMRLASSGASSIAAGSIRRCARRNRASALSPGMVLAAPLLHRPHARKPDRRPPSRRLHHPRNRTPGPPPTNTPGSTPSPGASDPLSR